jgi:hypothetical protein
LTSKNAIRDEKEEEERPKTIVSTLHTSQAAAEPKALKKGLAQLHLDLELKMGMAGMAPNDTEEQKSEIEKSNQENKHTPDVDDRATLDADTKEKAGLWNNKLPNTGSTAEVPKGY